MDSNSLLSIKELSKKLGISVTSLYRLRQKGIIKHIRIGGRVVFEYETVLKSLKEQSNYGGVLWKIIPSNKKNSAPAYSRQ